MLVIESSSKEGRFKLEGWKQTPFSLVLDFNNVDLANVSAEQIFFLLPSKLPLFSRLQDGVVL